MNKRKYQFGDEMPTNRKSKAQCSKELRLLLKKQQRWLTRVRRALTAIGKIERQIKRLNA
jgi:hypothetical protein